MHTQDLTEGNISRHLTVLAVPLILGNILQQFYNTIDAFVVGQFAGKEEFAAIGIAGTVMNLFLFAIVGCCTGFSVLFARYYGAGDKRGFRRQHFTAFAAGLAATLVLAAAGLLFLSGILNLIQTPEALKEHTASYLHWILLSLPAAFLYNLYASMLRAAGDTRAALYILAASVAANLGLDVLFVAGLSQGIVGAAKATAFTQLFSALLCLSWLAKGHREMLFKKEDCRLERGRLSSTIRFGAVTALHQTGLYIGKMLVQGAVNTAGTDTIASYTAATRIEGFVNSFGDSGSAATSIVTAQNYGAGKMERVRDTFFHSLRLLAALGICGSAVLFFTAGKTMGFMLGTGEGPAFSQAVSYLKIVSVFYLFCFAGNTFVGYFNGIGKIKIPFMGAVGHITLRVILSWLFIERFGLDAVAAATGIGWMCANLFWSFMKIVYTNKRRICENDRK